MTSASYNRFNVLEDMADTVTQGKSGSTSPPVKKSKKKTPPKSDSSNSKVDSCRGSNVNAPKDKNRRKSTQRSRLYSDDGPTKPNRRLVMSDSDCAKDEEAVIPPPNNDVIEPTPPDIQKCLATEFYVKLAKENHYIPSLSELVDKAGSFGSMFNDGCPVNYKATDIVNVDGIYGMRRQKFNERKVMWEEKSSLIFFEQGMIFQVFEREKIILFFSLLKKHKRRVPNLYRLYDACYDLENSDII